MEMVIIIMMMPLLKANFMSSESFFSDLHRVKTLGGQEAEISGWAQGAKMVANARNEYKSQQLYIKKPHGMTPPVAVPM